MQATDPKTIMITGAGQGIGRHFAERLAREGHRIAIVDVRDDAAQAVADDIAATGAETLALGIDITDDAAVAAAVEDITARFGGLDVLINNASIFSTLKMRPFYEIPVEEWRKVIDVNLTGGFLCARHVVAPMRAAGWGRIINVSSVNGSKGAFGQTNYAAAKAGMHGFTKSLALESARKGVTVNTISPGYIGTKMVTAIPKEILDSKILPQIPVGRLGKPEEIAGLIIYLCSEEAAFVTGANIAINGGQHMA